MKLQSALEYFTTHIWAIIVIAVIFVVLYELGLFSALSYAPKAAPGACSIQRGYNMEPTLTGQCLNELPEFVDYFPGGNGGQVTLPDPKLYWGDSNSFSLNVWTDYSNENTQYQTVVTKGSSALVFDLVLRGNVGPPYVQSIRYTGSCGVTRVSGPVPISNTWEDWAFTFDGNFMKIYVNGQQVTASTKPCSIWEDVGGTFDIGNAGVTTGVAPMYIANLQFYNTALSANSIQALYQEGLGGEPIDLADLIGWWPLNGDTLDYSGYGNNGYSPVNTVYVGNWWQSSTYTGAP